MLLWHGDEPIGVCVFGFGPLASPMRSKLFGLRGHLTRRRARWINRNFACVSRLVLDPRYRGAGIAAAFLRRCCELSEWPWIELVSEMGRVVPFCEAAGFRYVGLPADKTRRGRRLRAPPKDRTAFGQSNWTPEAFRVYWRRVRFSRPAYFIFDNRRAAARGRALHPI